MSRRARSPEEEKKETDSLSSIPSKEGNRRASREKDFGLRRPKAWAAPVDAAAPGAVADSALVRTLSKSLKRNLSITAANSESVRNLMSLSKSSKGERGPKKNETFTIQGTGGRTDGVASSHTARRLWTRPQTTHSGIAAPVESRKSQNQPSALSRRPNSNKFGVSFQEMSNVMLFPNQGARLFSGIGPTRASGGSLQQSNNATATPNQTMQLFSGTGSTRPRLQASHDAYSVPLIVGMGHKTNPGLSSNYDCDRSKEATGAMTRVNSMPMLNESDAEEEASTKASCNNEEGKETQQQHQNEVAIERVESMPQLAEEQNRDKANVEHKPSSSIDTSPDGYYKSIIGKLGYPNNPISFLNVKDYFLEYSPEQLAAYDHEVTYAVRSDDLVTLRRLFQNGKTMQCSNKFGESIVHMACRKGNLQIIRFLLEEAGVCIRLRDDFGRTPLHDACWAANPSFEAIRMLIQKEPDMLLLADRRGHTPLAYVRRETWGMWCEFLHSTRDLLVPRHLVKPKQMK